MIRHAREVLGPLEYDLCIVGSGPAGMIVATELADAGISICVIESGGEERTALADSLRALEQSGLAVRDSSRERVLGGSSSTWRGLSALFDQCDFKPRQGFESYEGWPISPDILLPYLKSASERYQFPPLDLFDVEKFAPQFKLRWQDLAPKAFVANRRAPNFGQEFRNLFARKHIDLVLGATVLRLESKETAVRSVWCKTPDNKDIEVRAKAFVVAAGAIENARILLTSGLGHEHDQVGRYFMDHPKGYRGRVRLSGDFPNLEEYAGTRVGPYIGYIGLRLGDDAQHKLGALNSYVQLSPDFPWSERQEITAAKSFGRALKSLQWRALPKAFVSLVAAAPWLAALVAVRVAYGVHPKPRRLRLRFFLDMEPRRNNRVVLSGETDALGIPKARVHHELSARDVASWKTLVDTLAAEFDHLGLGTVELNDETPPNEDASHHMGTTRMGQDPRTSVVDADLKVHSLPNVYIAGGSVFPTAGNANPTYTIAALSIRLAEHLRRVVFKAEPRMAPGAPADVLVVGAGRRVRADIVPMLESLGLLAKIFAPTPRLVVGPARSYLVEPLSAISQADISSARLLYVSVPPAQVPTVLKELTQYDCSRLTLMLPTPVIESSKTYWNSFARVYAEEDMVYLPWLPLVRRVGKVTGIRLDKSAYRYHAVALMRALVGGASAKVRSARTFLSTRRMRVGTARAVLVEPRDYTTGRLYIEGEKGKLSDKKEPGFEALELVRRDDSIGIRLGDEEVLLTPQEARLFGPLAQGDTVVTRMHDLKRVGLRRLVAAALAGEGWSAEDGLEDTRKAERGLFGYR